MAYEELVRLLAAAAREPYIDLVRRVDAPPRVSESCVSGETLTFEVAVHWLDRDAGSLRVVARGLGGSTWRLERLEEAITVIRPHSIEATVRDTPASGRTPPRRP